MLKITFYLIVLVAIIIAAASGYHLYKVNAKNKLEMKNFESEVKLDANLGKTLVVYYSLSGHTKDIAEQIAAKTNADLYEIKTVETYSSPSVYMKSKKELSSQNYPQLQNDNMPDVKKYDTVFVGAPVWWYTMAPALYSYLNMTDFNNVKVVPFSTQGSNFGSFFEDFAKVAKNARILQHESFNNMDEKYQSQISNKINNWLNQLAK
ncbi:MAG: NAD(P)H-dependent oxidoreductase [Alphaproteobacteria bacterium]|nr:NAD(P)H-dependent oxidoreductase [Alphaproteobacteria bacterium]